MHVNTSQLYVSQANKDSTHMLVFYHYFLSLITISHPFLLSKWSWHFQDWFRGLHTSSVMRDERHIPGLWILVSLYALDPCQTTCGWKCVLLHEAAEQFASHDCRMLIGMNQLHNLHVSYMQKLGTLLGTDKCVTEIWYFREPSKIVEGIVRRTMQRCASQVSIRVGLPNVRPMVWSNCCPCSYSEV